MDYDIRMTVKFCRKHKKFYTSEVVTQVGKEKRILAEKFLELWNDSSKCDLCTWRIHLNRLFKTLENPSSRKFGEIFE